MQQRLELIEKRTEKLEARSKMNSQNSSKPPSSDGPFNKQQKKTKKSKRKGNRWVERILSLKQTCRMRALPVFPILADAIDAYFKDQTPDLQWITSNY